MIQARHTQRFVRSFTYGASPALAAVTWAITGLAQVAPAPGPVDPAAPKAPPVVAPLPPAPPGGAGAPPPAPHTNAPPPNAPPPNAGEQPPLPTLPPASAPAPVVPAPAPLPAAPPGAEPAPLPSTGPAGPPSTGVPPATVFPSAAPPPAAPPPATAPSVGLPPPVPEATSFTDRVHYRVFADAYFSANYNFPKPQVGTNGPARAFHNANGFSVAWVGLDLEHPADPVGGALSLRFGPAATRYNSKCLARDPGAQCDSAFGLQFVKQAFVAWQPGGEDLPLRFELGKFDSIYGAEVADSQDNINYTRGVLYSLAEPWFHTGLRVGYEFSENFSAKALVVNGVNNSIDNNTGKSYGLQLEARVMAPDNEQERFSAKLGYFVGGERDDMTQVRCGADQVFDAARGGCADSQGTPAATYPVDQADANTTGLSHFVNLALAADPSAALHLMANGDLGIERRRERDGSDQFNQELFWGVMFGGRYALVEAFALALRAEYFADPDGNRAALGDVTFVSGTLTLDLQPSKNLIIRLDNRVDTASEAVFAEGVRDKSDLLVSTTLGAVVTTN